MKESIMNRASRIIKAYRLHKAWVAVFLCLALIVGFATTSKLTKSGVAMTEQVKELDCHVKIHKHTDACKDAEGNLVCGYADYIIHKHSEACYDSEGQLVCGLPEIKLHEHTAACYDADGVLICTEQTVLHTHTDACRDAEGHLICGLLEIQEHNHGEGCFRIVEIEVTEPETEAAAEPAETEAAEGVEPAEGAEPAAEAETEAAELQTDAETAEPQEAAEPAAEQPAQAEAELPEGFVGITIDIPELTVNVMPEQRFEQEVDGVKVVVEAGEGAFPAGTVMVVKTVAAEPYEAAVAGAVTDKITQMQAVDVTFVDAEGNEIEPAAPIKVSITSATIGETDEQLVMKVNEDGSVQRVEQEAIAEAAPAEEPEAAPAETAAAEPEAPAAE